MGLADLARERVAPDGAPGGDPLTPEQRLAFLTDAAAVLEGVARADPLPRTLARLCDLVEARCPDVRSSILLVRDGRLLHGAGPRLPIAYRDGIDGTPIGPSVGSCGTAAWHRRPVSVCDIATDPRWEGFSGLALTHGLRACWSTPVCASDGEVLGTFALYAGVPRAPTAAEEAAVEDVRHLTQIALEAARDRERLQRMATTDALTGLANRHLFDALLDREVAAVRQAGTALTLVLLDLDGFKLVNDLRGHEAGDAVLRNVARALGGAVHGTGTLARVGGDEFALLLPGGGTRDAVRAIDVLRRALLDLHLEDRLTLSAGAAQADQVVTPADLRRAAGLALHRAKAQGGDALVAYDPRETEDAEAAFRGGGVRRQRLQALGALARAIDAKDTSTREHSERVAAMARALALAAGWDHGAAARIEQAALLHDIGKIAVPDAVLTKDGPLDDAERAAVQRHPAVGADIVTGLLGADQVRWIRQHHERADGAGYPDGLVAGRTDAGSGLLALADAWDAMTSDRPYRRRLPEDEALEECRAQDGRQFAPHAVAALERLAAAGALPQRA